MPKRLLLLRASFEVPQPLSAAAIVATMLPGMMSTRSGASSTAHDGVTVPAHFVALCDIFQARALGRRPAAIVLFGDQPVTICRNRGVLTCDVRHYCPEKRFFLGVPEGYFRKSGSELLFALLREYSCLLLTLLLVVFITWAFLLVVSVCVFASTPPENVVVSNMSIAAPYRRMGVDIIRSPVGYKHSNTLFFHKFESGISNHIKIDFKSTYRNSPIPKLCHLKRAHLSINSENLCAISQITA